MADKRQGYIKLEQETVILENGGVMPEVKCKQRILLNFQKQEQWINLGINIIQYLKITGYLQFTGLLDS